MKTKSFNVCTTHIPNTKEQKENLLSLNNDLLYGVYEKALVKDDVIILKNIDNILTCFPEKFTQLQGISNNPDIIILNAASLRQGNIEVLTPHNPSIIHIPQNISLLSSGVIEVIESMYTDKNGIPHIRQHFPTTLRDGDGLGSGLRNPVAGRNSSEDLHSDIMREYSEESPFLTFKNGQFFLTIAHQDNKEQAIGHLRDSVKFFLENKYLDSHHPNFTKAKNIFEKSFRHKIIYENLGKILEDILKNNRFDFYSSEEIVDYTKFPGIEKNIRELQIIDNNKKALSRGKFFVNANTKNNTIEYMQLRQIQFPDGLISPNGKLYLESQNQGSKNERITTLGKHTLPIVKTFADTINKSLHFKLRFSKEKIHERQYLQDNKLKRKDIRTRTLEKNSENFQEINENSLKIIQKETENLVFNTKFNNFHRLLDIISQFKSYNNILKNSPEKAIKMAHANMNTTYNLSQGTNCSGMARELQSRLQAKGIHSYIVRFSAFGYLDNEYIADGHAGIIIPAKIKEKQKFIFLDPGIRITEPIIFDEHHSNTIECDNKIFSICKNTNSNTPFDYCLQVSGKENINIMLPFCANEKWLNPEETLIPESMRSRGVYKIQKFNPEKNENIVFFFDMIKESFGLQIEKTMEYISFEEFIKIFKNNYPSESREKFIKIFEKFGENPEEIIPKILDTLENLEIFQKTILTKNSLKILEERKMNLKK